VNTSQVMSIAQGAAPRKAAVMSARGNAAGKDGSFNDVLAKSKGDSLTLQDVKDLAKSAEVAENDAKLAEATESASTDADMPKEGKSEKSNDGKVETKDVNVGEAATEEVSGENFIAENISAVSLAPIVLDENGEVATETKLEFTPKEAANLNLHSILPQSSESLGKNKEMLAMLSGQHIPKNEGAVDLNNLQLNTKDAQKVFGEAFSNQDGKTVFAKTQDANPLSALTNTTTKFAKETVVSENAPIINVTSANTDANVKNARFVDEVNVLANNNLKGDIDIKAGSVDIKAAQQKQTEQEIILPNAKTVEVKAEPFAANLQNAKPAAENAPQNILSGVTLEIDDAEVLPLRETFNNFGQNLNNGENNEKQSLFNNSGKEEIFNSDSSSKIEPHRAENNQQFANTLETQNSNHTTGARETAPTTAPPRDAYNVREQIVQQARLIRAENGSEMVIRLKPEHLGDMTLRISVSSEGAVTASFFTNNAEVRHIVENSLVQLRQELQNQGIKVDKAEVYAGLSDGGLPQGQSGEAWQQNRGNSSNSAFRNAEADALQFEDDAANISNVSNANISADDGVDYLV